MVSYPQAEILKILDTFFPQCTLCTWHQLMAKGYFRMDKGLHTFVVGEGGGGDFWREQAERWKGVEIPHSDSGQSSPPKQNSDLL